MIEFTKQCMAQFIELIPLLIFLEEDKRSVFDIIGEACMIQIFLSDVQIYKNEGESDLIRIIKQIERVGTIFMSKLYYTQTNSVEAFLCTTCSIK